jgi:probable HAF family extracellular repeat protein
MKLRSSLRAFACVAAACGTVVAAQAAPAYHLIDLGIDTVANAVNSHGAVAGGSTVEGAAVWHDGAWDPRPHAIGFFGIDDDNEVAGTGSLGPKRSQRPAYWPRRGAPIEIVTPYIGNKTWGIGVAAGRVVGHGRGFDGVDHCFTWTLAGGTVDLATAAGGAWCTAGGINAAGQMTGYAVPAGGDYVNAFIWQDGVLSFLGALPGGSSSYGRAINRKGHVAVTGDRMTANGPTIHAAVWNGSRLVELGELFEGGESDVAWLNDHDDVVGRANDAQRHVYKTFLRTDGQIYDLATLVDNIGDWDLGFPSAITDDGTIVGTGDLDFHVHGYILVPLTPLHR